MSTDRTTACFDEVTARAVETRVAPLPASRTQAETRNHLKLLFEAAASAERNAGWQDVAREARCVVFARGERNNPRSRHRDLALGRSISRPSSTTATSPAFASKCFPPAPSVGASSIAVAPAAGVSAKPGEFNWSAQHSNLLAKMECGHETAIRRIYYSAAQRSEIWDRWQAGEPMSAIGRRFDRESSSVFSVISPTGGIRPPVRYRAKQALSLSEREEISRWLSMRCSLRSIARHLGRSASTISREVQRNGGADRYRAAGSDQAAWDRARRPKLCKLACRPFLRRTVSSLLRRQWSPEQIAGWLKRTYPVEPQKQVSHETIYRSLFILARGVLKKELLEHLRARRTVRRSRHASMKRNGLGQIKNAVSISERPPSVEDRAVPGHWEGDLIGGSRNSYIATLVERHSRYVMLVKVANKDTESVVSARSSNHSDYPASFTGR